MLKRALVLLGIGILALSVTQGESFAQELIVTNGSVVGIGEADTNYAYPDWGVVTDEQAKTLAEAWAKQNAHRSFRSLRDVLNFFGVNIVITSESLTKPGHYVGPGSYPVEDKYGAEYTIWYAPGGPGSP